MADAEGNAREQQQQQQQQQEQSWSESAEKNRGAVSGESVISGESSMDAGNGEEKSSGAGAPQPRIEAAAESNATQGKSEQDGAAKVEEGVGSTNDLDATTKSLQAEEVASSVSSSSRVHRPPSAWMNSATPSPDSKPPLLKRVADLELNLRSIEDKYSPRSVVDGPGSARSSCLSTPSSIERRRKPIDYVLGETEEKGTLVERVAKLEERVDSLNMQLSSTVPVLKSPPVRSVKDVATPAPPDLPAVEEKHEINGATPAAAAAREDEGGRQQAHKMKKKHRLPLLLKNCIAGSA